MAINVVLNVVDNISSKFDDIDKKAKETEKGVTRNFRKIGAAVAIAGAAITLVVGKIFQMTKEYAKLEQQVRTTFGTSGQLLKEQISLIKSLTSVYDGDFSTILKSSNALAKEFGITTSHALGLVKRGFEVGANANGEFLDILKEYPAQMKSVGISAEETIAIITQQAKEGVFSDKGIDAIKEAGLRLREMNKGTKESIQFLGMQRAEEIDLAIAKGDTFKAIQLVSKGLKETTLSASEAQLIISNVFGGPGEDAGRRYLETLGDINTSLDDLETTASLVTIAQQNMLNSFNNFVDGVLQGEGPISQAFANILDSITGVLDGLNMINLYGGGESFKTKMQVAKFLPGDLAQFERTTRLGIKQDLESGMSPQQAIEEAKKGVYQVGYKAEIKKLEKELEGLNWFQKNFGRTNVSKVNRLEEIKQAQKYYDIMNRARSDKFDQISQDYLPKTNYNPTGNNNNNLPTGDLTDTKPSSFGSQNKVSEITIHVEKQIETVNINSGENIQSLKDQLQRLLTEIVVDANQFGLR